MFLFVRQTNKSACIVFFIQNLGDSGCDNFQKVLVQYKLTSYGQWRDKQVGVTDTQMTIHNLQPGHYSVRLSVTNNENINSKSDIVSYSVGREFDFELLCLARVRQIH